MKKLKASHIEDRGESTGEVGIIAQPNEEEKAPSAAAAGPKRDVGKQKKLIDGLLTLCMEKLGEEADKGYQEMYQMQSQYKGDDKLDAIGEELMKAYMDYSMESMEAFESFKLNSLIFNIRSKANKLTGNFASDMEMGKTENFVPSMNFDISANADEINIFETV